MNRSEALPWTNVYGVARTLIALGTLLTLLLNDTDALFRPAGLTVGEAAGGSTLVRFSLFALVPVEYLGLAKWLAIGVLIGVISGWRPRITGLLHWYVAFSFASTCFLIDGGEHVTAVLTLLLVPVTLTDSRKWHWSTAPPVSAESPLGRHLTRLMAVSSLLAIRLQVAVIYFHAGVGKMSVTEWANGTAVYYWFTDPGFGAPAWLQPLIIPALTNSVTVTALTWGVILFEIGLAAALVMDRRWWPPLLKLGLLFHFGIILVHGIVTFAIVMWAALILYLRPFEDGFRFALPQSVQRYAAFLKVLPSYPRRSRSVERLA